jgi:hypothetical protein
MARHIIDEFFGIQHSQLAPGLGQGVDDLDAEAAKPGVESPEQTGRPRADDDQIHRARVFTHWSLRHLRLLRSGCFAASHYNLGEIPFRSSVPPRPRRSPPSTPPGGCVPILSGLAAL